MPGRGRGRLVVPAVAVAPAVSGLGVCPQPRVVILDVGPDVGVGLPGVVRAVVAVQVEF